MRKRVVRTYWGRVLGHGRHRTSAAIRHHGVESVVALALAAIAAALVALFGPTSAGGQAVESLIYAVAAVLILLGVLTVVNVALAPSRMEGEASRASLAEHRQSDELHSLRAQNLERQVELAERERDAARRRVADLERPADVTRRFLIFIRDAEKMMDRLDVPLGQMADALDQMPGTWDDWINDIATVMLADRPQYVLRFRDAQVAPYRGYSGLLPVSERYEDGTTSRPVYYPQVEEWRQRIRQVAAVLREIVDAG